MRIITTLISTLCFGGIFAQTPNANELYQRIVNYYLQHPGRLEVIKNHHKNVFEYDTTVSTFYYLPLERNGFYLFYADSANSITSGIHFSTKYFVVDANSPEKILTRRKYIDYRLDYVPARHCNNLTAINQRFGRIISITGKDDRYVAITNKSILEIDTGSYRITRLSEMAVFNKQYHQYNDFYYLELPDTTITSIREQATTLIQASNDFPIVTFKDLDKRRPSPIKHEGTSFAFGNPVSFNKGPLDSSIKNKYLIIDFFYQACLPCHKMTGYILDWLPSIDSSKILLIGVNPFDSEKSMKVEVEKRGINYPIVIGQFAGEMSKKYVQGYPTLLLVSPEGIIKIIQHGMSKNFLARAEKIISQ